MSLARTFGKILIGLWNVKQSKSHPTMMWLIHSILIASLLSIYKCVWENPRFYRVEMLIEWVLPCFFHLLLLWTSPLPYKLFINVCKDVSYFCSNCLLALPKWIMGEKQVKIHIHVWCWKIPDVVKATPT